MNSIPAAADIKASLSGMSNAQLTKLSELSGVPFSTLWKVRAGETGNPGIETVRKFMPYVADAKTEQAA